MPPAPDLARLQAGIAARAAAPYRRRCIRFLEAAEHRGWRLKVYGISAYGVLPRPEVVEAARRAAERALPPDPEGEGRHGIAVVIAHEGREGNYSLVAWWFGADMAEHRVFAAPSAAPGEMQERPGLLACVWELRVYAFERDAWVRHVLANPAGPDLQGYLWERLNEDA